jgi:hypothetical protein
MKRCATTILASAFWLLWCPPVLVATQEQFPNAISYTLRTTDGEQSISVSDEHTINEPWSPFGGTGYSLHKKGRSARDTVIRAYGASFRVAKGTPITFAGWPGMSMCLFTLGEDVPVTLGNASLVFKGGAELYVEAWAIAGTIARETAVSVDETTIVCAAGSQLAFQRWALGSAKLASGSSVTHAGRQYPCAGLALFRVQDGERTVSFAVSQDVDLRLAGGLLRCPSGSSIYFEGPHIRDITLSGDVTIQLKGKPHSVKQGQTVRLDDQGNVTGIVQLY